MNILIIVSKLYPEWVGGTETQTRYLAKELSKNNKVSILTKLYPKYRNPFTDKVFVAPGRTVPRKEYDGNVVISRVKYINFPLVSFFTYLFRLFIQIIKKRHKTDLLLCMQLTPNGFIGTILKKIIGVPVISYVYDYIHNVHRVETNYSPRVAFYSKLKGEIKDLNPEILR